MFYNFRGILNIGIAGFSESEELWQQKAIVTINKEELNTTTGKYIKEGEGWKRVIGLNEQRIKQLEKESQK